jgi:hypothetical protein
MARAVRLMPSHDFLSCSVLSVISVVNPSALRTRRRQPLRKLHGPSVVVYARGRRLRFADTLMAWHARTSESRRR